MACLAFDDFVLGANKKSFGLYGNILQLCLIVYGVDSPVSVSSSQAAAITSKSASNAPKFASKKWPAPSGEVTELTCRPYRLSLPTRPETHISPLCACGIATAAIVDDFSDSEDEEGADPDEDADLESDEIRTELRQLFGANAERVRRILKLWNSYADLYTALCDEWTSDTQQYRDERAFQVLKSSATLLDHLNIVSDRRHKSCYPHQFMTTVSRQIRAEGDLWRFSTRSVEGRGGRIKRISRSIVCWRRRCSSYQRSVRTKTGHRVITQAYNSTPEKQMLRAAISYEDRIHSSKRSRITLTGRNTLVRTIPKAQQAAMPALGDALEPERLKRMC